MDNLIMKLSLRRFLFVGLMSVFLCGCFTAFTLWYSTNYTTHAIEAMAKSVESATAMQSMQRNLSVHRRQSLLKSLHSQSERRAQSDLAKEKLLAVVAVLPRYMSTPNEAAKAEDVKEGILAYLAHYEALRSEGLRTTDLYESASEKFYLAEAAIQDLVASNLEEASRLQVRTSQQYRRNYIAISAAFLLLILSVIWLLNGLRKLFFQPILRLRKTIESYELGFSVVPEHSDGAQEIQAISSSFRLLSERLARQKNAQLTFLAAIAHDLRNPLGAIKMSIELISEDEAISNESKEMIEIVSRQSDHLLRLVSDLLDTTRVESGQINLQFAALDIRNLVKDSATLHSKLSSLHQVIVHVPDGAVCVNADEQRLIQVFNNLLNNAIKYSPNGGVIEADVSVSDGFACVDIIDHGVGVPEKELEGIFEPFRRSSTTRDNIPGIGLGLSASRKIIRAHMGGEIRAKSNSSDGTVFSVRLPLFEGETRVNA